MKNLILLLMVLITCACQQKNVQFSQQAAKQVDLKLPFQPNVIWLVAEDLSPVIPSFGDSTIQTPNLSRLAAEGICYDNFYSPSPVCAPSRAAIATSMYPTHIAANNMRTGPWFATDMPEEFIRRFDHLLPEGISNYEALPPTGVRMFSEYLREAGYYCTNNAKQDYQFRCSLTAWDETSDKAHWKNRTSGQPFFSIFNFNVTHESQIWARAKDSLWVAEDLAVPVPPYLPDTEIGRQDVRRMYSNVKMMDHQVGELLKELEASNLLDSTIIFWYTDHGGPLPRQKRLLYDSGLKVPMIIRFPHKQLAGQRDDQMISFIDLGPSVLSLVGLTPPKVDGKAFLGPHKVPKRNYIYAAADRFDAQYDTNRAVRDKRYKYIKYYQPDKPMLLPVKYREQMPIMQELNKLAAEGKLTLEQAQWYRTTKPTEELFDTEKDPHEVNNLAEDAAYAEKLTELRKKCEAWTKSFEDTGLIPEKELVEKLRPEGEDLKVATPKVVAADGVVSLSCKTEAATIGYQIVSKTKQATSWNIYTKPFSINEGDTLKVVADRIGYRYSEIITTGGK